MSAVSGGEASEGSKDGPDRKSGGGSDDSPLGDPVAGDAWNPGLESEIPRRLKPLVTLFRAGNGTVSFAEAQELADLTGLDPIELARLTPERLIAHELLVRVTADLSVPDGPNYADLGISLRGMVGVLFERHVVPELATIHAAFDAEMIRAGEIIDLELAAVLPDSRAAPVPGASRGEPPGGGSPEDGSRGGGAAGGFSPKRLLGALFAPGPGRTRPGSGAGRNDAGASGEGAPDETRELDAIARWRRELSESPDGLRHACLEGLVRTVGAVLAHRGRLFADRELLGRVALGLAGNVRGAALVGEMIEPLVARGVEREGYRLLPPREAPVVMNVKGASASGKSTIRPRQRELAGKLGIPWEDFALISPDYWRKYLLDYASLGEDFRYAAMLTGRELEIVDRKLDAYMAAKAARGTMSHLLIDRFRFDSFTLEENRTGETRLLTRFGRRVYMFFMVTPPAETVERAWVRGCKTGRYKAVSDLLYHNVEAFTGMPALFLSWVNVEDRDVRFEFLDNDVPEDSLPRTAAFGSNGSMTVLDVPLLCAIDRYREVNVEARRAEDVLPDAGTGDEPVPVRTDFVRRCAERIARLRFADRDTGEIYARVEKGRLLWWDRRYVERPDTAEAVRAALDALGRDPASDPGPDPSPGDGIDLALERHVTVGRWGPAANTP